ncbi:putative phenylalanine aminotransferase [Arthrobacter sp. StoSoilB22]|nr:putative phenylalanine aminotransferase [Arthrobacter sp. StoSoilB22]
MRYPDNDASELRSRIAEHHGLSSSQVAVGNGSLALVEQLMHVLVDPGDQVIVGDPSFIGYSSVGKVAQADIVRVPLSGSSLDLEAMAVAITDRTRIIFVCTPNNPTGGIVGALELESFLKAVPTDVLVVIDEAYREFVDDPRAANGVDFLDRANVLCLRTFSKAYGLAGLRIGYGLGDPQLIAALRSVQLPFGVNALAQRAATLSLDSQTELEGRVATVVSERLRLEEALTDIGLDVRPSQGNFVWIVLEEDTASTVKALAARGVLIRGYGHGMRATIGSPADNDAFLTALTSVRDRTGE